MTIITICPNCGREHEVDTDTLIVNCHACGERYDLREDENEHELDPDYGGAFDGFTVTSDADPGL